MYFDFFKKYNHLYKNFSFDEDVLKKFEADNINIANEQSDDESSDSDDDEKCDSEPERTSISATIITDKYGEDSQAPTVANKLADMIVQFERDSTVLDSSDVLIFDPEDEIYIEELNEVIEDEDEDEVEDIDIDLFKVVNYLIFEN